MIIQRNVERDRLIPVITLHTYVVVNFFILGNFSFSFVSVSLAYITILKNQRKQKLPEKKNQLVTTKFIFLTEDTLFCNCAHVLHITAEDAGEVRFVYNWSLLIPKYFVWLTTIWQDKQNLAKANKICSSRKYAYLPFPTKRVFLRQPPNSY